MIENGSEHIIDKSELKVGWRRRLNGYLLGVAHTMDFPGVLCPRNPYEGLSPWEAATRSLSSDWARVAQDFQRAKDVLGVNQVVKKSDNPQ